MKTTLPLTVVTFHVALGAVRVVDGEEENRRSRRSRREETLPSPRSHAHKHKALALRPAPRRTTAHCCLFRRAVRCGRRCLLPTLPARRDGGRDYIFLLKYCTLGGWACVRLKCTYTPA